MGGRKCWNFHTVSSKAVFHTVLHSHWCARFISVKICILHKKVVSYNTRFGYTKVIFKTELIWLSNASKVMRPDTAMYFSGVLFMYVFAFVVREIVLILLCQILRLQDIVMLLTAKSGTYFWKVAQIFSISVRVIF